MKDIFYKAMPHVFASEGGYVDHPSDPGGATKYGITIGTLSSWRKRSVSKTEVKNLTKDEATEIYKANYWDAVHGDDLPAGVDYCVFDAAINSGPRRAIKWLQMSVGSTADGIIGPKTLSAVSRIPSEDLIDSYCNTRLTFLKRLKTWNVFGRGWTSRVERVRKDSKAYSMSVKDRILNKVFGV